MPKIISPLSELTVKSIKKPGLHSVGGATGLKLQITKNMARSWILRATVGRKVCDIGLGSYPTVSLKEARELANKTRLQIIQGIDPIAEKQRIKDQLSQERAARKTFDECSHACIAALESEWSNRKSSQQWHNTLKTYASPVIGKLPVSSIQTEHLVTILEPIWSSKPETASRVRGRIEKVLAYATTRGFRSGDNPARYKGHLDTILPAISKLKGNKHHPALDYHDINSFINKLRQRKGMAAKALEFSILTAARSGEARGAKWSEFDLTKKLWTIPAERMKAKKQHIVPLSRQALAILTSLKQAQASEYVFHGPRGGQMSATSLAELVKDIHNRAMKEGSRGFTDKYSDNRIVTPHGFRSTFRDWAGEQSPFARDVIEHALAHQLKDKSEAAYHRKTSVPKRIKLMQSWADYCDLKQPNSSKTNLVHTGSK